MQDSYKTVESLTEGLYKEKGSRFISFIYPVETEEEIKTIVADIKSRYFDARHHCFAWILGADKKSFRFNDDGEPSSTAGKPIYGQLLSNDLTNVLLVVIRYFGGTKLGVSGLIQAYREAAADAIRNALIVEKTVDETIRISFDYTVMNQVMKVLKEENANISSRELEMVCSMQLRVRQSDMPQLKRRLEKIESLFID